MLFSVFRIDRECLINDLHSVLGKSDIATTEHVEHNIRGGMLFNEKSVCNTDSGL